MCGVKRRARCGSRWNEHAARAIIRRRPWSREPQLCDVSLEL